MLTFDNWFIRDLPGDGNPALQTRQVHGALHTPTQPTPVAAPQLLALVPELAEAIGFAPEDVEAPDFVQVFAGNALYPGMQPWASCYGGHQFGHWAGQLGDGRAISLGEALGRDGRRHELQLKGAGRTPFSRHADGRAVLRSSLREFVCSEAMHHLGIPTTRALCLIATGEPVVRDMFYDGRPRAEPGAIVCRVAPSFLRFGHYELPTARGDVALLTRLVDFTLARDYPELTGPIAQRRADWFIEVCERTATLIAHWMRVGFVHGVMNTDNLSILGLTIDYGPYGWLEPYDPEWTPNTTDFEGRRYAYGRQPLIGQWNLSALAGALAPLFPDQAPLQQGLRTYAETFHRTYAAHMAAKFGLVEARSDDGELISAALELMREAEIDWTLAFRQLAAGAPDAALWESISDDPAAFARARPAISDWMQRYAARLQQDGRSPAERQAAMNAVNPLYVPRNYLAQLAIDAAEQGDLAPLQRWMAVLRQPCTEQPGQAEYAAPRPAWARQRPGCSMLSCSS